MNKQNTEHRTHSSIVRCLLLLSCVCLLLETGCTVGPDYQAPKQNVPDNWIGTAGWFSTDI